MQTELEVRILSIDVEAVKKKLGFKTKDVMTQNNKGIYDSQGINIDDYKEITFDRQIKK